MVSKYAKYQDEIIELLKQNGNKHDAAARIIADKYGLNAESGGVKSTLRIFCKKLKEARVGNNVTSKTSANDYFKPFVLSAWNKKGYMMDIDEYCSQYNLPRQDITSYKLVSHTGTPFYNIVFKTKEEFKDDLTEDFIDAAIKKYIKPQKPFLVRGITSPHTLRIVITDTHIGMETDASGFGLYGGIWNKEELFARGETILYEVMHYAVMFDYFEEIHLIDLGDYMDGWDAETVRKGHELPQNMDNQKAFDVGLDFKIKLIDSIAKLEVTNKIRVFNICNDNHSGSFGYVVNSAVKKVVELLYPDLVQVTNYRQFINHYTYGKHCFVLTHGKDEKHLKFGFKPILDKPGIDKIIEYLDVNELHGYWVTFEKGDSHQQLFDQTTSDKFNYNNYMALSPASEWVQTNYKRGRSGFNLQIVEKEKKGIVQIPYEFDWKVKEKSA